MHPLVEQALSMRPGHKEIAMAQLGQDVTFSQIICGFTMTVESVYADANRVVIGYTLSGPPDRVLRVGMGMLPPTLMDAAGRELRFLEGGGRSDANETGCYASFDAGPIAHPITAVDLRLTIPFIAAHEYWGDQLPVIVPCELYNNVTGMGPNTREVRVLGPMVFNLHVVTDTRCRIADVFHKEYIDDFEVTLERVIVTPSETRVYLRNDPPQDVLVELKIDGESIVGGEGRWPSNQAHTVQSWVTPLYNRHGRWTITVHSRRGEVGGQWMWTGTPALFQVSMESM